MDESSLMTDATSNATLEANKASEHVCASQGVKPKKYHANNGCFAEDKFMQDCKDKMQKITFCGVGAHHLWRILSNSLP